MCFLFLGEGSVRGGCIGTFSDLLSPSKTRWIVFDVISKQFRKPRDLALDRTLCKGELLRVSNDGLIVRTERNNPRRVLCLLGYPTHHAYRCTGVPEWVCRLEWRVCPVGGFLYLFEFSVSLDVLAPCSPLCYSFAAGEWERIPSIRTMVRKR